MGRQIVCCAKGVAFSRSCGILGSEKKPVRKGLPMQKFDHVLLASDFDNTLVYTQSALDNGTDIPPMCPRNREALDYFIQNGGLFAISTGRALPAFMDYAKDVPMSAPCVIANGAAIYDFRANEYLYTAFLGEAIYDHMAEVLARFPTLAFEVYHDDCRIHAMNPNRYIRNHEHLTRSPVQVVERFADIDLPIIKILFEEDFPVLDAVRTFILSRPWGREYELIYSNEHLLELTAAGAKFPIIIYTPYNTGSTYDTQRVQVFEQMLERNLGTDYIDVITEGYADTDYSNSTMRAGNYCIMRSTWMADYLDPLSYTDPFRIVQNRTNFIYMAEGFCKVSDTYVEGSYEGKDGRYYYDIVYDNMVEEANSEYVDLNKRYDLFAECENWLVNEMCMVIPYMRGGTGYMGSSLMPFESQYAAFGASSGRYKYQYIYTDGINTEEYYEAYEAWQEERAAKIAELDAAGKVFGVDY